MSKLKSNRGAAKRFKRTALGGYRRACSHLNHILTKKSSKRKRKLGPLAMVHPSDVAGVKRMLP